MTDDDLFDIPVLFDRLLRKIFNAMRTELSEVDLPIQPHDTKMLMIVRENKSMPISKLVTLTSRDKSQITRKVRELENNGLISRSPSPSDQRVSLIALTPKGEKIAIMLEQALLEVLGQVLVPLSKSEKRVFADILRKVTAPTGLQ